MRLLEKFTEKEKIACISFLKLIAVADQKLDFGEAILIQLLILSLGIDIGRYDQMSDQELYEILASLDHDKSLECLRIGYSIMSLNHIYDPEEIKYMQLLADMHDIEIKAFPKMYESIKGTHDMTALDQLVLVALAKYMTLAEGYIKKSKVELLVVLSDMMGIPSYVVESMDIPFDLLLSAVHSMSHDSVERILEELVAIMIADNQITSQEYDLILPILSQFQVDFNATIILAKERLIYNQEYYRLLSSQSEIN